MEEDQRKLQPSQLAGSAKITSLALAFRQNPYHQDPLTSLNPACSPNISTFPAKHLSCSRRFAISWGEYDGETAGGERQSQTKTHSVKAEKTERGRQGPLIESIPLCLH